MFEKKVYDWKPNGHIYLFRVLDGPLSYKGTWHLAFDVRCKESFLSLVKLLQKVDANIKKTISLANPIQASLLPIDVQRWTIQTWDKFVLSKSDSDDFCIREIDGHLHLLIGGSGISTFISELEKVASQNERVIQNVCQEKKQKLIIWW